LPDYQQTEEFEELVLEKYAHCSAYKGLTPGEAELTFLNKAKWLEMYGVDMHSVYGRDQNEYKLGLTPSGILVFEETTPTNNTIPSVANISETPPQQNNKIGLFYWPKIERVTFSKKKFTILVAEDDSRGFKQEHTFIFNLIDEKACKHLWKCAVEYHTFFRLRSSLKMPLGSSGSDSAASAAAVASQTIINGFIRRGSRFRGPERTEFQTANMSRLITPRRSVQFERRPSQRFSRRASYAIKRKLQEQHKIRTTQGAVSPVIVESDTTKKESTSNLINFSLHENCAEEPVVVAKPVIPPRQSLPTVNHQTNALVPSLSDTRLDKPVEANLNISSSGSESSSSSSSSTSNSMLIEKSNVISAKIAENVVPTLPSPLPKNDVLINKGFSRKPTLTKVQATATTFTNGKIVVSSVVAAAAVNRNKSLSLNSNPLSSSSCSSSTSSTGSQNSNNHFQLRMNNAHVNHKNHPITTEI
jgi:hypothetical protein